MPNLSDYRERQKVLDKGGKGRVDHRSYQLGAMWKASLDAQYVTQSDQWNSILQHLQAILDKGDKAVLSIRDQILHDQSLTMDGRINLMMRMHKLEGHSEAIRMVMGLPKELMEMGKLAEPMPSGPGDV